jgi:hypothetical protein
MKLYGKVWRVANVSLAAVGTSIAFAESFAAFTALFVYFGALGMLLTLGFVAEYWERSSGGRRRLLAGGAMVGAGAACSFIGFASLLGPGVLPLTFLVLASSPYALRTCHRWLRVVQRSKCAEAFAHACAYVHPHYVSRRQRDVSTLTDEQLCQRWRASYLALMQASPREVSVIAVERQRYLDEFERRNRSGFTAWLGSGPLASASPMPYLVGVPTINWDDLIREQGS